MPLLSALSFAPLSHGGQFRCCNPVSIASQWRLSSRRLKQRIRRNFVHYRQCMYRPNKLQATPADSLFDSGQCCQSFATAKDHVVQAVSSPDPCHVGGDNSTAFAEAIFILQQNRVSVALTSSGLQLTRLGCRFPCCGSRRIPPSGTQSFNGQAVSRSACTRSHATHLPSNAA